jgi:hypothetical protein
MCPAARGYQALNHERPVAAGELELDLKRYVAAGGCLQPNFCTDCQGS